MPKDKMKGNNMLSDKRMVLFVKALLLVIIAVISCTLLRGYFTSNAFTEDKIEYLDEKRNTVLEITAASTAASVAITMLPTDWGSPVAEKLSDVSTYSLIVLCALFLEKYILTITGNLAFKWLIPIACLIWAWELFFPDEKLKKFAIKIAAFASLTFLVIPISVRISRTIENTYDNSIQETIDSAKESTQEIQENAKDQNLLDKFLNTVSGGVTSVLKNFEGILNRFIEAIAVLIVTSAVIPILVMIFFVWLVKVIVENISDIPVIPMKKLGFRHTQE